MDGGSMDFKDYKLLAFLSPEDERDYKLPLAPAKIEEVEITYPGEVKDQGDIGMCVAMACSYSREIVEYFQSKNFKLFSEGFIYGNREYGDYKGEGMYPREALKNLQKVGAVLKSDFQLVGTYPVVSEAVLAQKEQLYKLAYPYRITSYYRIYNANEVIASLKSNMPVIIVIPIYSSFYLVDKDGVVKKPGQNEQFYGYHAMLIVGVKKINETFYYKVLNSWSKKWGSNGYCYIPLDFDIPEMWAFTDTILPDDINKKDNNKLQENKKVNPVNTKYTIRVGVYLNKQYANNKITQLRSKGFLKAYVVQDENKFYVNYGEYSNINDAKTMSNVLSSNGFPNVIISK